MKRICTIYALSDPRLDKLWENVRYVGKTRHDLHDRLVRHLYQRDNSYRQNWIKSLKAENASPIIWPLAFCNDENWQDVEKFWIKKLRPISRLTNLTDGGEGQSGRLWSDEAKKRLSEIKKLRPMSREMLMKVCAANSAANKGKKRGPRSEAVKARLSEIAKARKPTKEIPVLCVETGIIFKSKAEAARNMGVINQTLYEAVKLGTRCKGFHWKEAKN